MHHGGHYRTQDEDPEVVWAEGMSDISHFFCIAPAQCRQKDTEKRILATDETRIITDVSYQLSGRIVYLLNALAMLRK